MHTKQNIQFQYLANSDTRSRVDSTIRIATAGRRELETMCDRAGVRHSEQTSSALRQVLKQRLMLA